MKLDNLYRSLILDHAKNPRNKGLKGYPSCHLRNPSCGDEVTMEALIKDNKLQEVNHDGHGCSICCASASVLSVLAKGKSIDDAKVLIKEYYKMVKGFEDIDEELLDEAIAFRGVHQFPARYKCATISWQALAEILGEKDEQEKLL